MRKLVLLTAVLVMIPATAMASDLEDLLERGHEASYSAEQIITCSNPDGVADAVVRLSQSGGDLHIAAPVSSDVEITTGYGGWTLSQAGSVVSSTELDSGEDPVARAVLDAEQVTTTLAVPVLTIQMRGLCERPHALDTV